MSLYRHVPSKDELFIQMVDVVMGDHRLVGSPPGDLRLGLELAGRTLWTVFRRHPWAAAALSLTRPRATPNALAYSEWVMRLLTEAGLHDHHVFQVHLTLFSYIRGMAVNLEWEAAAEAETGLTFDEYMDTQDDRFAAVVHSGGYPTVVELFTRTDFDLNLDELFEFGLRHLLDGFVGLLR